MNKKIIWFAIAMTLSGTTLADSNNNQNGAIKGDTIYNYGGNTINRGGKSIGIGQGGQGGQGGQSYSNQGQQQGMTSVQGINSSVDTIGSGNETSVNVDASTNDDYKHTYHDYTPNGYAPNTYTSAPCYIGISAGGGAPGISFSAGGAIYDEECEHRETIRLAYSSNSMQVQELANKAMIMKLQKIIEKAEEAEEAEEVFKKEHNLFIETNS